MKCEVCNETEPIENDIICYKCYNERCLAEWSATHEDIEEVERDMDMLQANAWRDMDNG